MQGRDVSETARHHKNHPHMVRHDNKQQGVYERNRTYAMPTVAERLVEVAEQRKVRTDFTTDLRVYMSEVRARSRSAVARARVYFALVYACLSLPLYATLIPLSAII